MGELILQDILIIFVFSIPVVILFQQLRLPSILGFLVTGALIGPEGIAMIPEKERIDILAELGVALLLFSVGLEFSFEGFARMRSKSLSSGILQIALTICVGMLIGMLLGWSRYWGIYFGCLMSLSSTAVVISTLYDRRMLDSIPGQLSTFILIMQDMALIPMMVLLPLVGQQGDSGETWRSLIEGGDGTYLDYGCFVAGPISREPHPPPDLTHSKSRTLRDCDYGDRTGYGVAHRYPRPLFCARCLSGRTDDRHDAVQVPSALRYLSVPLLFQ